ncbi:cytochrome C oxidase subunit IV family protein [Bacteroidota bacterium]
MSNEKHHIIPYKTYILVLAVLIVLTLLSVAITQIELSSYSTIAAMIIAGIKSTFILLIFMHLKYDQRIFKVMVSLIIGLVFLVIFITMLDYIFR